ncbi:hypothetical protein L249_0324, partial [Ophiocordyceps polyrhachis-furcata BCC 54312]
MYTTINPLPPSRSPRGQSIVASSIRNGTSEDAQQRPLRTPPCSSLVACTDSASRLVPNHGKQRQKYGKNGQSVNLGRPVMHPWRPSLEGKEKQEKKKGEGEGEDEDEDENDDEGGICTIIRGEKKGETTRNKCTVVGTIKKKDVMRWVVVGFAPRGNISQVKASRMDARSAWTAKPGSFNVT